MTNVQAENPSVVGRSMGKRIPNLIFQYDNEKGSEFRVQCEVPLVNEADAKAVKEALTKGTEEALKQAKAKVFGLIDPGASPVFKQIVEQAFDDNIKQLRSRERR